MYFWQKYRSDISSSQGIILVGTMKSVCLITGDVNLIHLAKLVSARFIHCKVTIFLFVINKYLRRDTLRLSKYPVSPQTFAHSFNAHQQTLLTPITGIAPLSTGNMFQDLPSGCLKLQIILNPIDTVFPIHKYL